MTIPDTANAASAAPVLSETARAKVNLTLRVLGRRVDGRARPRGRCARIAAEGSTATTYRSRGS